MKDKIIIDLRKIMDEFFDSAQSFGEAVHEGFKGHSYKDGDDFFWDEKIDYYPAYSYPPANVYLEEDKSIVFEFALAGFDENSLNLEFIGDYMVFSATAPDRSHLNENVRFFKKRLKFKDIKNQKYYVAEDKFDREKVKASFKNGILRVAIPAKAEFTTKEGVKIEIVKEEEE